MRCEYTHTARYTVTSTVGGTIYQGVIATPPRNAALWRMLDRVLQTRPEDMTRQ